MSIDNFTSEELNVKDIVLENPENKNESFFDPRRDITKDDKEKISGMVRWFTRPDASGETLRFATTLMGQINLLKYVNQNVTLTEHDWGKIADTLVNQPVFTDMSEDTLFHSTASYIHQAWSLYVLDSSKAKQIQERIGFTNEQLLNSAKTSAIGYLDHIYLYKMSFPNQGFAIDKELLEPAITRAGTLEKSYAQSGDDQVLKSYIGHLARLKLVSPEVFEAVKVNNAHLHKARSLLESARLQNKYDEFLDLAFDLTVLSAKEIKMTPQGLQVIMPEEDKKFDDKTQTPEIRKF